jgi:hypothetical protein
MNIGGKTRSSGRSRAKTIVFSLVLVVILALFMEISGRCALFLLYGAGPVRPGAAVYYFYPRLEAILKSSERPDEDHFDVLLLGASVMNQVAPRLRQALQNRLPGEARVFNVSAPAHTSLDSYYKFRRLEGRRFDLVVIYHAINEVRANNIPRSDFRRDYSHYSWYATINLLERHRGRFRSAIPVVGGLAWIHIKEFLGMTAYLPTEQTPKEYREYGSRIKTREPFRRNLSSILDMAARREEEVVLMTFAHYLPEDYSHERFLNEKLDYYDYDLPVRTWGTPENVEAGIAAHNEVIKELAGEYENAILVDEEAKIADDGSLFTDICHFSPQGQRLFVTNLVRELDPILDDWSDSRFARD